MSNEAPRVGVDTRGYIVIASGKGEHVALLVQKRERQGKHGVIREVQITRWNKLGSKWKPFAWIGFERVKRHATPEDLRRFEVPA